MKRGTNYFPPTNEVTYCDWRLFIVFRLLTAIFILFGAFSPSQHTWASYRITEDTPKIKWAYSGWGAIATLRAAGDMDGHTNAGTGSPVTSFFFFKIYKFCLKRKKVKTNHTGLALSKTGVLLLVHHDRRQRCTLSTGTAQQRATTR
jgi:hypothetical protein